MYTIGWENADLIIGESMKEERRHIDAFELYFQLRQQGKGVRDAVAIVAKEQNRSESTIYTWKREFDWDSREAVRAAEIRKKVEEEIDESITDAKVKYLTIVNLSLDQYLEDVKEGRRKPIKMTSTMDIERFIKLALLLIGENTERAEVNTGGLDRLAETIRRSIQRKG